LDRLERLGEPALHGGGEVVAERLELVERALEVLALRREVDQPFLLALVLLLGERIDLAEGLTAPLEALDPLRQLVTVVALGRIGPGFAEPAASLVGLGVEAGPLDVEDVEPLGGLGCGPAEVDLGGAEPAELVGQLAGAGRASVSARTQ